MTNCIPYHVYKSKKDASFANQILPWYWNLFWWFPAPVHSLELLLKLVLEITRELVLTVLFLRLNMVQVSEKYRYLLYNASLPVDLIYFFLFLMQKMFHLYYCRLIIHLLDLGLQRALFSYKTWLHTHSNIHKHTRIHTFSK